MRPQSHLFCRVNNCLSCFLHFKRSSPRFLASAAVSPLADALCWAGGPALFAVSRCDAGSAEQPSLLLASSLCRCYTAQDAPALCSCRDTPAAPAPPAHHPEPQRSTRALPALSAVALYPSFYAIHKLGKIIMCYPETSLETAGRVGSITGSHSTFLSPSSPALPLRAQPGSSRRSPAPMSLEGKPMADLRS